jgi:Peptidase_C39 like family
MNIVCGIAACFAAFTLLRGADPVRVAPSRFAWWPAPGLLRSASSPTNVVVTTPPFQPGFAWKEAVVSWNTSHASGLTARARPVWKEETGPWYTLAHWCPSTNIAPRTSLSGQRDSKAWVETDTLIVAAPADGIELEFSFTTEEGRVPADLRLGVSLLGESLSEPEPEPFTQAWGTLLSLPVRSQADFPEGIHSWCSPTSLSMILSRWSEQLQRPDLLQDVPQVARGVHDPGWPGTGNWSFNAAYAGQHPGISACVTRLAGIADLERWIAAGNPVAVSVSYAQLKGSAKPRPGDGHLVVASGFTPTGDVQIHDPGVRRDRVVRTIPRADFQRAWNHSQRTAYLVWSRQRPIPAGGMGRWPESP